MSLKDILSPEDYEEMKYSGFISDIEAGNKMPNYLDWLKVHKPNLDLTWPHIRYIGDKIDQLMSGEIEKLMISTPPRHGKSECVTIPLPVYVISKNPTYRAIVASYNQTLATKFSAKSRTLAKEAQVDLNPKKLQRDDWETVKGGGVRAVGALGGIAGYGANVVVIDDPVRNRKDANSDTIMSQLYDWYRDDIYTRLEPEMGRMLLIATRWHEWDLFGRILDNEGLYSPENPTGWTVVNLPALAEKDDILGRDVGEALCPERFDRETLLQIKKSLGNGFNALYQGRPTQQEGGMFKRRDFLFAERIPKEEEPHLKYYRCWDSGASKNKGDYTCGVLLAYSTRSKHIFIVDVVRGQWETNTRKQRMLKIAREDNVRYGNVYIRFEVEGGSSGKDVEKDTIRLLQGFSVKGIPSRTNKQLRAEPFAAQVQGGNVTLIKGLWNRDYLDEMTVFPNGKHDDQVDASSGAFNDAMSGQSFILVGGKRVEVTPSSV